MDWCSIDYERYPKYEDLLSVGVVSRRRILRREIHDGVVLQNWYGHSPSPYRVNVVLSNLAQFARDFKCPLGSRLHPPVEERCAVW